MAVLKHSPPEFPAVPPVDLRTDEDLDQALRRLASIDARTKGDAAELKQRVDAITAEIQGRAFVTVGREVVPVADYRSKLEEAAAQYVEANRFRLFAGKKGKTRRFTFGEVGFRKERAKLVDVDGSKDTTEAKLLFASDTFGVGGLLVRLLGVLAKLKVNAKVSAKDLFKVKLDVDRTRILALAAEKALSAEWLAERNLRVDEGGDVVFVKPDGAFLASESRAAA